MYALLLPKNLGFIIRQLVNNIFYVLLARVIAAISMVICMVVSGCVGIIYIVCLD